MSGSCLRTDVIGQEQQAYLIWLRAEAPLTDGQAPLIE